MIDLNLDPHQMVDSALIRINADPLNYEAITKIELNRVLNVAQAGVIRTADVITNPSSISQGFDQLQYGNWIHGLPFDFVEVIKTVSFFLSLILLILFFSIWLRLRPMNKPDISITDEITPPQPVPGGPMMARWQEIMNHMDSVKEAEWKFAIIEADKLVEEALRKGGFPGDTLGEKLSLIHPDQLAGLDGLWEAHKVRNHVAHDFNYFLRYTEAKYAINQYERALRELEAI